jgi:hypothetical protein
VTSQDGAAVYEAQVEDVAFLLAPRAEGVDGQPVALQDGELRDSPPEPAGDPQCGADPRSASPSVDAELFGRKADVLRATGRGRFQQVKFLHVLHGADARQVARRVHETWFTALLCSAADARHAARLGRRDRNSGAKKEAPLARGFLVLPQP